MTPREGHFFSEKNRFRVIIWVIICDDQTEKNRRFAGTPEITFVKLREVTFFLFPNLGRPFPHNSCISVREKFILFLGMLPMVFYG